MNGLAAAEIEKYAMKSDPSYRETLLHLPLSLDYDSNALNDLVSASDSRGIDTKDTITMNVFDKFMTKDPDSAPSTLTMPIGASGGPTDAIRSSRCQSEWTIDEQIAAGFFPVLFLLPCSSA